MKVIIVTYVYPPEVQSMGVMAGELAEDLAARGHAVTVLTGWPNHPRGVLFDGWRSGYRNVQRASEGFRLIRSGHAIHPRTSLFWRMWHYLTFAVGSFFNGLAAGRLDVVVCMSTPIFGTWSCWLLAKCKGARLVYEIDDLHPEAARNAGLMGEGLLYRVLRALDTKLCRLSDAIVTLSEGLRDAILQRGLPPETVTIVPFWIDERKIRPCDRLNPWREAHGIPPDKFVALYAGTIGLVSGADILVEAARQLQPKANILILCVGEGVVKDRMEARAKELKLGNMLFLPFQPAEVMPLFQATADVGLVTLLPDAGASSMPSKMLGYLAAGRPVIASVREDTATAHAITEGRCGRVVPCQDPTALARAIAQSAEEKAWLREAGRNGREYFLRNYSRSNVTRLWESLLRRVRARGGP
jgi:colanic acid biosynthesis glycosyl transferase WcaI